MGGLNKAAERTSEGANFVRKNLLEKAGDAWG